MVYYMSGSWLDIPGKMHTLILRKTLHRLFLLLGSRDSLFSRSKVAGLQICQAWQYSSWYKICYSVWEWTGLGVYLATRYLYVKWNTLRSSWLHTYRLHTCIWERYSYYVNKVYNEIFILMMKILIVKKIKYL